jgi:tetratricopeptide (TPR) repeat protein
MKILLMLSFALSVPGCAQTMNHAAMHSWSPDPNERLGTVSFAVLCKASSQAPFDRGVALLHDFWYEESQPQFERIVATDPGCAMAHWGIAMSVFHQIWDRPGPASMKLGWAEMQKAQAAGAKTERERAYIAALSDFNHPGPAGFPARIAAYSAAMGKLYEKYPEDVDAGAFYALSLLAAATPGDTSLTQEHKAMAVLTPLFAKAPENPGVDHYIIHACDNPSMAADGLAAADHYGEIAPSGPHAFHMPGHIYARLGLWPQDIDSQLGSIAAANEAAKHGESGLMDEPHSYDFVEYAYLQSGQDAKAKWALGQDAAALKELQAMPGGGANYMAGMVPYYEVKLPAFYELEMRDWKAAAALKAPAAASPEVQMMVAWAHAIADGHLNHAVAAQADLAKYDALLGELKKGPDAYVADGTGVKIERGEIVAWTAFAGGKQQDALMLMRGAADLQDKVGQGEVDIPAREMLADMLLAFNQPQQALAEYEVALKLSPRRLNGLYNAARAAEAAGDRDKAQYFYAALLKSTNNGANSSRPEFAHAKSFVGSSQVAAK